MDLDAPQFGALIDRSVDITQFLQLLELPQTLVRAHHALDASQEPGLGLGLDVGAHGELARDEAGGKDHDDQGGGTDELRVHGGIIGAESGGEEVRS